MTPTDARPSGQPAADYAPVYRLLKTGETVEHGDEFWSGLMWKPSGFNGGKVDSNSNPMRRAFSPVVPRVVVVLEGGCLADVLSDARVDVLKIDYDCEGSEACYLVPIPQTDNTSGYSDALVATYQKAGLDGERVGELFGAVARHTTPGVVVPTLSARVVIELLEKFDVHQFDAVFDTIKEECRPHFSKIALVAEEMATSLDAEDERPSNLALHARRMAISNWATAREGLE